MKYIIQCIVLVVMISCEKTKVSERKPNYIDTLHYDYNILTDKIDSTNYVIIDSVTSSIEKDSSITAIFNLEFYKKHTLYGKDTLEMKYYNKYYIWASYTLDSIHTNFITISKSGEGCGMPYEEIVYDISKESPKKVYRFIVVFNGEYFEEYKKYKFLSKTEISTYVHSFIPSEKDEYGVHEFRDSIHYLYENNAWKPKYITPKGKIYRKFYSKITY